MEILNSPYGIYAISAVIMLLSYIISQTLKSRFEKYSVVPINGNLTGAQVAEKMLRENEINDVKIQPVSGSLTDFYDPRNKTLNLSEQVYGASSVAAAAVAAHETGHAIQHAKGYGPLRFRSAMVPVVSFASNAVMWVLLLGIFTVNVFPQILWAGIGLFALTTLFSFITLPVEINASNRAVQWLSRAGITNADTTPLAVDALKWAAYTYVVAALGSLATLFYYISIARRR
ncbi:MAG: zinc metallopeptidase [Bacteroidales bacterium]|nr:zinc metallopeptidase [Bacteroidales bacterium]